MGAESKIISVRISAENLSAATLVAKRTHRSVSGLAEYALELYMRKNYPSAFVAGRVDLLLDEAPKEGE